MRANYTPCRDDADPCEKTISEGVFEQGLHAEVHGTGRLASHQVSGKKLMQLPAEKNSQSRTPAFAIITTDEIL